MAYFKEYPYVMEQVDSSYDRFLNTLKEVVKITDQLFVTQIHPQYGMYPEGFGQWIESHQDYVPDALSVTRLENTTAKEIPFNTFYSTAMERISKHLDEAKDAVEGITEDAFDKTWWSEYLTTLQKGYLENAWDDAEAFFLSMPVDSPVLFIAGPIDTYHDKLQGIKKSFSAWLLIKNKVAQKETDDLCTNLSTINEPTQYKIENVSFFIGDLLFSGGEVAKHNTMGWSRSFLKVIAFNKLPEHTKRMAKAMEKSLQTWDISESLGKEVMEFHMKDSLLPLVLHEYCHTYNKSPKAHKNLGPFYTDIEETRANTYMAHLANILEKQKHLPEKTTRNIVLRVLLYLPYLYEEYAVRNQRESYYFAGLFWLKKAEEHGIIRIEKTIMLHEDVLEKNLVTMIEDAAKYLSVLSDTGVSEKDLVKQKEDIFLYGADLAIKLSW